VHNAVGIVVSKSEEFENAARIRLLIMAGEAILVAADGDQRSPPQAHRLRRRVQQPMVVHVENAGRIFGAPHVTRKPEQRIGDAGQHGNRDPNCLPAAPRYPCCLRLATSSPPWIPASAQLWSTRPATLRPCRR